LLTSNVPLIRCTVRPSPSNHVYSASVPSLPADRDDGLLSSVLVIPANATVIAASVTSAATSTASGRSVARVIRLPRSGAVLPGGGSLRSVSASAPRLQRRREPSNTTPDRTSPLQARAAQAGRHRWTRSPAVPEWSTPR